MNKWKEKQTALFFLICFGGTYLMGILLACAYFIGYDTSVFATTQMLYPAAAVIVTFLVSNKKETLPIKFFEKYLVITVLWSYILKKHLVCLLRIKRNPIF